MPIDKKVYEEKVQRLKAVFLAVKEQRDEHKEKIAEKLEELKSGDRD
jgi:hypothetical protein